MEKYNGWPNYATWLIKTLDLIDYEGLEIDENLDYYGNTHKIAEEIQEQVFNLLDCDPEGLAKTLALELLGEVRWDDLAAVHLLSFEDFQKINKK